jgi:hypothetical protein
MNVADVADKYLIAFPRMNSNSREKRARLRPLEVARKGPPREAYLSPIDEGETPEEDISSRKRYNEAIVLLRNPQPKAVVPYEPSSEAADRNLRRIMYHCG